MGFLAPGGFPQRRLWDRERLWKTFVRRVAEFDEMLGRRRGVVAFSFSFFGGVGVGGAFPFFCLGGGGVFVFLV